MLIEAFGFGCAYWFLDALLCYFNNGSTNFIKELFQPDPLAFYRRVMVLSVLVLFVSHILSKFRQLEGKLQEYTVFNQTLLRNTNNPSEKSGGMSPDVPTGPDAQKVFFYIPQYGSLKSSSWHKVLGYRVHIPSNVIPSNLG